MRYGGTYVFNPCVREDHAACVGSGEAQQNQLYFECACPCHEGPYAAAWQEELGRAAVNRSYEEFLRNVEAIFGGRIGDGGPF